MAISVQLNADELAELRGQALALAKEMAVWLEAHTAAPDYFDRMKKLRELISELDNWENQGILIQTSTNLAGAAVDQINMATTALKSAAARVASIGSKIEAFGAFVDLMVAISSGDPDAIIKNGIILKNAAENA